MYQLTGMDISFWKRIIAFFRLATASAQYV